MHAHTAVPARRQHGRSRAAYDHRHREAATWRLPVVIGVAYGAYAWFLARDERFTAEAAVVGLVSGAAMAVVCLGLGRLRRVLVREVRAAAYGGVLGCGIGYLSSLTGPSVLWSSVLGLGIAAGVAPVAFYVFYTHEE